MHSSKCINTGIFRIYHEHVVKIKLDKKKIIIRSGKKKKLYVYFVSTVNMYTFVREKDEMWKYTGTPTDGTAVEVWSNSHNLIYKESKGQHLAIIPYFGNIWYLKFHLIINLSWKYSSNTVIFKCKRTGTCSRIQSPRYWDCNLRDTFSGKFRSLPSVQPHESAVLCYLLGRHTW